MSGRDYQLCTRCVMDTSDQEIVFDDQGQCNHCIEYADSISGLIYQGESSDRELERLTAEIKEVGKNNAYDCVVGISGGGDSCYLAYLAKKLGLRPLAVHMDNGWNSLEAVENMKNVCSNLEIDFQSYVLEWEQFKDIQLAFLKSSIVEVEIPTDFVLQVAVHKIASDNNIKYILSGCNYATEGILPNSWFYNPKDSKLFKAIYKRFASKKIKSFPTFDYWDEMYYKFFKGIKIKYPLNLVPFSKDDAMNTLENELGWKYYGGKHYESKYTGFVQSYIQPKKFNVDYRRATFSTQICTGAMDREEALQELEKKPFPFDPEKIDEEIAYVSKKLGITVDEFTELMNSPPKSYKDYPNNEVFLEFIYKTYRRIMS